MPRGQCRLCQDEAELQLSHILPAFTFRWLRETSGGGHIRLGSSPNHRVQDGPKRYWLCASCEGIFNRSETTFAGQLFHPYGSAPGGRFIYRKWLLHFCASVSWRVLRFYTDEQHVKDYEPEALARIANAEATWRAFLLGQRPHPGQFQQHLLPLDAISNATGGLPPNLSPNINRYLMCDIDMDLCRGNRSIFVYSKLGRFIILGFVSEEHPTRNWRGTKIHATEGVIEPRKYVLPKPFWEYLNSKARQMSSILDGVSSRQQQKIDEAFRLNVDKIIGSDLFAAMKADFEIFGEAAFSKPQLPSNNGR